MTRIFCPYWEISWARRTQDPLVRPFQMSFWWRPYSRIEQPLFDAGMEQYMNRFALFVGQRQDRPDLRITVLPLDAPDPGSGRVLRRRDRVPVSKAGGR